MIKFSYDKELCLVNNNDTLFKGVKFWVRGQGGDKQYLNVVKTSDLEVEFSKYFLLL